MKKLLNLLTSPDQPTNASPHESWRAQQMPLGQSEQDAEDRAALATELETLAGTLRLTSIPAEHVAEALQRLATKVSPATRAMEAFNAARAAERPGFRILEDLPRLDRN